MSTWRTAWRKLTKEAGLPGLRFHDLRHHAITELAESLASDQTIMSLAGHVSPRMLAHYSHVRLDAKRKALDALSGGASGVVTSQSTSQNTSAPAEVTEKYGGDDETRTRDLCRDRRPVFHRHTQNQSVTRAFVGNRWLCGSPLGELVQPFVQPPISRYAR